MAKQNVAVSVGSRLAARPDATVNHEEGLAFTLDPRSTLHTRVVSSFVGEKQFYQSAEAGDQSLVDAVLAVAAIDPEFVLRLAAYARQVMHIRSTPIVLLAEAAAIPACKPFVRKWTPAIIQRADEPGEVIAYWVKRHGAIGSQGTTGGDHGLPDCLKKGIADALTRFGEYHFAKYDRDGSVKLRDVLRITHPKPSTPERSALYRYLVKGEIDATLLPKLAARAALLRKGEFDAEAQALAVTADATWEVVTSKFGTKPEIWNAAKLPFMAGIRNLANLLKAGALEALDRVIAMLQDPTHVQRSHQLPFRFYTAYRTVEALSGVDPLRKQRVLDALVVALELSVANLPRLSGVTFVTADNSGSMDHALSERSVVHYRDVANLLASIAHTMCEEAVTSVFGTNHVFVTPVRKDSVLTNMARFAAAGDSGGTNAYLTIRDLRERGTVVDRIILLSDMQCYDTQARADWCGGPSGSLAEELVKYRSSVNPRVVLYSVDLAGYGTAQFPGDDKRVALLSGWSEKLLAFIPLFEGDGMQAVDQIAAWAPGTAVHTLPDTEDPA